MVLTRRSLLAAAAASPFVLSAAFKNIPIGLELYSVRGELKKDEMSTLSKVAQIGYQCVEFFAPYFEWTPEHARDIRKKLDSLNLRCYSTHNGHQNFTPEMLPKAIELNKILGARFVVMSSPGKVDGLDGWKQIAKLLDTANGELEKHGLHSGYHNHAVEWTPIDGQRPMDVLAANTDKSVVLQFDVGTCLEKDQNPVAWIDKNPGRIKSMHLKDWSPEHGYRVLFGEGVAPWKKIFAAAESVGGVEYYLMEQEGSDYSEFDTAARCLAEYKKIHG